MVDWAEGDSKTAQAFASLRAKADAGGTVRVIVGLRVAFTPEGELSSPQAVQLQRTAIDRVQNALLRVLASHQVGAVKKFEFIPYLAMEVDAAGLSYLKSAPDVISICEDTPNFSTPGPDDLTINSNHSPESEGEKECENC